MKIPERLKAVLYKDERLAAKVVTCVDPFVDILTKNDLCLFREYTEHGIKHIEQTLQNVENLIAEETFDLLTPEEVSVIIIAVVLHDIGMHTNLEMFKNMIDGNYDNVQGLFFKEKTWKVMWKEYLYDSRYWTTEKKVNVFGDDESNHLIETPNLNNLQFLNEYDKKLIGEFVRANHCRIAYEVSQLGFIGSETIPFDNNRLFSSALIKIAGIVARSHGMAVRDTFDYLKRHFGNRATPLGFHAVFLMILLRLADYLHIDNSRTNEILQRTKNTYSPYSRQEHLTHQAISGIQFEDDEDKERIIIHAMPEDAKTFTKIKYLVEEIQKEFDQSWAILGEVYHNNKYKLRYRRINANIEEDDFKKELTYAPKTFCYSFNNELSKLLISPLYGDNPTYGIRELVQNAVDACRECMNDIKADEEKPHVIVELDTQKSLLTITDTGKGMTLHEIEYYFLTIGSSYNGDVNWQKKREQEHTFRAGRFGIGILAAYLLGPVINVETRSRYSEIGYTFTTSLHEKYIQINKAPHATFGTKIKIICNEASLIKLIKGIGKFINIGTSDCFSWYIGNKPKVTYIFNGKQMPINSTRMEGFKYLKHSSKLYGPILWRPRDIFAKKTEVPCLYCNDFYITNISNKQNFSIENLEGYIYDMCIPDLQITDIYNLLPLNLQRNNIEGDFVYDFEPSLAHAINIDIICQLMAINIRHIPIKMLERFYFNSSGFIYDNVYGKRQLVGKLIIDIGIERELIKIEEWLDFFKSFSNYMFRFHYRPSYMFLEKNDLVNSLGFAITSGDPRSMYSYKSLAFPFSQIFEGKLRGYRHCFIYDSENLFEKLFKQTIDFYENKYKKMPLFVIVNQFVDTTPIPDLEVLYDKYMNKDFVIPYDPIEREKKYSQIHRDYREDIQKYKAEL